MDPTVYYGLHFTSVSIDGKMRWIQQNTAYNFGWFGLVWSNQVYGHNFEKPNLTKPNLPGPIGILHFVKPHLRVNQKKFCSLGQMGAKKIDLKVWAN